MANVQIVFLLVLLGCASQEKPLPKVEMVRIYDR
jgi:hypothetical protein